VAEFHGKGRLGILERLGMLGILKKLK